MSQPEPANPPRIFESRIRVRYAETDQMGVVYHANYLVWFEIGRVELLRELGFDYKAMEQEMDTGVVVVDAHLRYKSPARYDDQLLIKTRVLSLRRYLLKFGYEIVREANGTLLCEGETLHVITNGRLEKRGLPAECEAALLAAMRRG